MNHFTHTGCLPDGFDTPIFWNDADLEELKGSPTLGALNHFSDCLIPEKAFLPERLGKEEAERDYREKILPAIRVSSSASGSQMRQGPDSSSSYLWAFG